MPAANIFCSPPQVLSCMPSTLIHPQEKDLVLHPTLQNAFAIPDTTALKRQVLSKRALGEAPTAVRAVQEAATIVNQLRGI